VAHGFWLLMTHDRKQEMVLQPYSPCHNLLSISQLVDADLHVLFQKSDSQVLDTVGNLVCGVSRIENVFQDDFSLAQSSLWCLLS
jgi:hypothetical protein